MLLIAIAVKLDSKGPALFRQTRVGKGGKKFVFYKFRSMFENAEQIRDSLMHLNEADGPVFKIRHDPRVTRVGHFLRRTSLDELPQLMNVLKGDMSLVGPRPPLPCEVEKYSSLQWRRLKVPPGVTCIWQISGRSEVPFDRWIEMDLEYIRGQSLWLDFKILLKTIPAVLLQRGAR
jgi:lipopolysaccharide/colanic/teichoic acid biosynthesis glycosyltransferase